MKHAIGLFLALLLSACTTPPRPSTEQERLVAHEAINVVEVAVAALHAAGKLNDDRFKLAGEQIAATRRFVDDSATTPITPSALLARVTSLSLAWIPAKQ